MGEEGGEMGEEGGEMGEEGDEMGEEGGEFKGMKERCVLIVMQHVCLNVCLLVPVMQHVCLNVCLLVPVNKDRENVLTFKC